MIGNKNTWLGVAKDGSQRQISHEDLMKWALKNDCQHQVGWSNSFCDTNGVRLVRGENMITAAISAGWNDLALMLKSAGYSDAVQVEKVMGIYEVRRSQNGYYVIKIFNTVARALSKEEAHNLCAKLNRLDKLEAVCREIVEDHDSFEYGVAQKLKAVLEEA